MSNPFTDQDAEALAAALESVAIPAGGMSLEQLDGFLCGLAVSPEAIAQADWMPRVWGQAALAERLAERATHEGLIGRLQAAIALRVQRTEAELSDEDMPFVWVPEDGEPPNEDIPVGAEWADGFLEAVGFAEAQWAQWEDRDPWVTEALDLIGSLSGGEGFDEPGDDGRLQIVGQLPAILHDLYVGGLKRKTPQQPLRKAAVPGRNDLCRCGSGRKFKVCCGKN